jgi:hypothetical protein
MLFSCKKEKDTNGITYQLRSSSPSGPISGSMLGGTVQWTGGYASVVEIEFEAESNNIEVEYKSEVKQKINLFSPLSTIGVITVPPGVYEDIEYEVEVQSNGTDAALQLNGSYTNSNGLTTPVAFKVSTALEIESEQANVTIVDGVDLTAHTTFNLFVLTTGVTETMLNNATRTAGVIEISATSNTDMYNIIFDNLKKCGGVEVD